MQSAGIYDFIVVGGGTAGCALAHRLSASPQHEVLLIEAGGKDDYLWIHVPVGYLYCINNPRTDWMYRTAAEPGLHGRSLLYPRGKVLGGCSSINGMIYMRGQASDYDHWADVCGDDSWRWDKVLEWFRLSEDYHGGEDRWHGSGGPWRVEKQRLSWKILDAFRAAAAETGIPYTEDFNRGDNEGSAYFEVNQKRGIRWNTTKAYLREASRRPNLTIMTGCQAERLLFDDVNDAARCTGVQFTGGGTRWQAQARRETVLAAGAIGSPALLQLSGIGDPAYLQAAGVTPLHTLPGVGKNLQDHLQLRSVYKVQGVPTLNGLTQHWWNKAAIGLEYLLRQSGPMAMAPSQLGLFTRSDASVATPDLQYHVQPLSLDKFGDPLHPFPAFTASVCHLRPTSRGTVQISSPDPQQAPQIAPNYLGTEYDRQVAAQALRLTRRIVAAPALQAYQPEEIRPGLHCQTEQELQHAAGEIGTTIFHPSGTCRMGKADDAQAVTDSRLRVRGLRGLRIADASVMPQITSGNTNSPTLMIAEKAAQMMLQDVLSGA